MYNRKWQWNGINGISSVSWLCNVLHFSIGQFRRSHRHSFPRSPNSFSNSMHFFGNVWEKAPSVLHADNPARKRQSILFLSSQSAKAGTNISIHSRFSVNRSFCQICQNCIREKNSAKNLPLTGFEPSTLGLTVLLTSCLSCLTPVLDCIAWKTET